MHTTRQILSVASIFQSGMVLQRDKKIIIWGNAPAGSTVTATIEKNSASSVANDQQQYQIALAPMAAGEDFILTITCDAPNERPIELYNISIGDVWLASGQSNMEFFLRYEQDWKAIQKYEKNPKIHLFNVPQVAFEGHTTHCKSGYGYWLQEGDEGFDKFSAPAYSFARNIQPAIGVPIGIIGCNWGGTSACAWVPEDVLKEAPLDHYLKEYDEAIADIDPDELRKESLTAWKFEDSAEHGKDFEPFLYGRPRAWQLSYMKEHENDPVIPLGPYHMYRPCGLYHMMLSTIIPFSLKGVLWYQGESDAGERASMYDKLFSGLISAWRKDWGDELPFLFVQLAPFGKWLACGNEAYAVVREKQQLVADTVPNCYMASIMDLGNYYDIHPKAKLEVGRRLALLARGHVYGEKDLLCDSPRLASAVLTDDKRIDLSFLHADGLTMTDNSNTLVCAADDVPFVPDEVTIEDDHLMIAVPKDVLTGNPKLTVSLGWDDFAEIFIHNQAGLPIAPFTTDVAR